MLYIKPQAALESHNVFKTGAFNHSATHPLCFHGGKRTSIKRQARPYTFARQKEQ